MYDVLMGVAIFILGIVMGALCYSVCDTASEQKKTADSVKKDLEVIKLETEHLKQLKAEIDAYNSIQKKEFEETEEDIKKNLDSTVEMYDNVTKILGGINVNK